MHLVFYTDFADMKRIIGHNWSAFSKTITKVSKEVILTKLEDLEPLRNKVAHNRPICLEELDLLKTYCVYFAQYLPDMPEMSLGRKVSVTGEQLAESLLGLLTELKQNREKVEKLERGCEVARWMEFSSKFWLYEHRISVGYEDLYNLYSNLQEYMNISRIIGAGDLVRTFVRDSRLIGLIDSCIAKLISDVRAMGLGMKLYGEGEGT